MGIERDQKRQSKKEWEEWDGCKEKKVIKRKHGVREQIVLLQHQYAGHTHSHISANANTHTHFCKHTNRPRSHQSMVLGASRQ